MRRPLSLALTAALLASCQPKAGVVAPKPAAASSKPAASTAPHPTAPAALLRAPAQGTVELSGQVALDARYAAKNARATVLDVAGSQVLGIDGVVGNNGAAIISDNGGGLVNAAGQLVANNGGNVIVPAELAQLDGSKLIANNGSSLIGKYGLLQATEPEARPLPAAGMWVSAVDLRTGLPAPLGVDDAGKPVYTVYSDAAGKFKLHVPETLAANARVVARAPGTTDPRLALHVIVPARQGGPVDEATAAVTADFRLIIGTSLVDLVTSSIEQVAKAMASSLGGTQGEAFQGLITAQLTAFKQAVNAAGAEKLSLARKREMALLATDVLLADLDIAALKTKDGQATTKAMADFLAQANAAAAKAVPPGQDIEAFFAAKPYVIAANQALPAGERFRIRKPGDMGDFLVRQYLVRPENVHLAAMDHVLYDLGLPRAASDQARAVAISLTSSVIARYFSGTATLADGSTGPIAQRMQEVAAAAVPALLAAPEPPVPTDGPPASTPPVAAAWEVTTLVRGGTPSLHLPTAVVEVPGQQPPVLYVLHEGAGPLRRFRLDAAGKATGEVVVASEHPQAPKLADMRDMVLAPDGTLYVTGPHAHAVRRIKLKPDGSLEAIEDVAGTEAPGFRDGPGAQAQFDAPGGLLLDAGGDLLVSDFNNYRIRRVDLHAAGFPVTTVAGSGQDTAREGKPAIATGLGAPGSITRGAGGTYVFCADSALWRLDGASPQAEVRFLAGRGNIGVVQGFWNAANFGTGDPLASDGLGMVYVVNRAANRILEVSAAGDVVAIAGGGPTSTEPGGGAFADGVGEAARFNWPGALAVASDGSLWVADTVNEAIRRVRRK